MPDHQIGKTVYTFDFAQNSFPGTVFAGEYAAQPVAGVGADLTIYLMKGDEKYASSYGETAAKILGFFSEKFGPLPDGHLSLDGGFDAGPLVAGRDGREGARGGTEGR